MNDAAVTRYLPYYKDNENIADNTAYPYIQKWGELRIDDVGVSKKNGLKGKFGPTKPFTRLQLVQLVRAFFS